MRSRWVVAAGAALLLAAFPACQQVLGLDRYEKVDASPDCTGTGCDEGGVDVIATVDADDSGSFVLPDGVAEATSWAAWPMPNPPFDAGAAWDATAYPLHFENAGLIDAGLVFDNVTKLFWRQVGSQSPVKSFAAAKGFCDDLGADAGTKWRVPTRIELITLLDNRGVNDAGAAYVQTPIALTAGVYWTASVVRPVKAIPPSFWMVNFANAGLDQQQDEQKSTSAYVECVRAQ